MSYLQFDVFSILAITTAVCSTLILYFFVNIVMKRIKRLEKKTVEIIKSYSQLHDSVVASRNSAKKNGRINYMEGDLDLVKEGKKATFRAIYYPKKVKKINRPD